MSRLTADAEYLAWRVSETVRNPPPGVAPWRGRELERILAAASRHAEDHAAFHLMFVDGVRGLLDEREDAIFHRYTTHARLAEARVNADHTAQRDHLTHVSQVYLLGWLLLNGTRTFALSSSEWRPYGWDAGDHQFDLLNRGWLYASLLHDCGYSMEKSPDSIRHELRIAAVYGDFFDVGVAGDANEVRLRKAAELVWEWRKRHVLPDATSDDLRQTLDEQVRLRDHAILTGAALLQEACAVRAASGATADVASVLEAAGAAIASHNFQFLIAKTQREWFQLDFYEEPLAALLHLADELQEWSRERVDEALLRLTPATKIRYAATEISQLEMKDTAGLTVDVGLVRRLHPPDRRRKHRIVWDQERSIAETATRLRQLFRYRSAPPEFRLHLRARQTIDDRQCSTELTVDWPPSRRGPIGTVVDSIPRDLREAAVLDQTGDAVLRLHPDGRVEEQRRHPRLVIVNEGGAGKSTLLRALAHSTAARVLYVEEFPPYAADLAQEVAALGPAAEGLLLVDHLDRLEDAAHGAFWLAQLRSIAEVNGLRIICACRPDAHTRFVEASLGRAFVRGSLEGAPTPFVDGRVDPNGRPRATGIAAQLPGPDHRVLVALGRVALSWGTARRGDVASAELPMVMFGSEPRPLLTDTRDGGSRFVHDAVQDFLSAYALASDLAEFGRDPIVARGLVRQLIGVPREVPRLLFDLLADCSRTLPETTRRRAAETLARVFLADGNLRFWLWHKDRYRILVPALEAFLAAHQTSPIVRASTHALLAHAYDANLPSLPRVGEPLRPDQRSSYVRAHGHYAEAAKAAEEAADQGKLDESSMAQLCVFIADHALRSINRLRARDPDFAAELASNLMSSLPVRRDAPPGSLAWLRTRVGLILKAEGGGEWLQASVEIDDELQRWCATHERAPNLETALAHHGAHISGSYNYWLEHTRDDSLARLALEWNQRGRARFDRVRRRLESGGHDPSCDSDATLPDARANAASRESYQMQTHFLLWRPDLPAERQRRLGLDLLETHQRQRTAWNIARNDLAPGERLSQVYRNVLPYLVAGDLLEWAVVRPTTPSRTELEAEALHLLKRELVALPAVAEQSPRFPSDNEAEFFDEVQERLSGKDLMACILTLASHTRYRTHAR